jgi:UDP-glucose:(heptosyl)LPS alpha-1,3-glucosyltransferase
MSRAGRKWRVAVITPRFTTVGGGERYCVETCRHLSRSPDIELTVICEQLVEPLPNIRFIEIGRREFPRFLKKKRFVKRVQKVLAKECFDLVHSHEQVPGANISSLHGTPHMTWVEQVRGKKKPSLFDRNKIELETNMLLHPACRAILPASTLVREVYEEVYDFSGKRIDLAPPGVDEQWLSTNIDVPAARQATRGQLGIGESEFVVGFVSMNWPHKGLDLLIESAQELKNKHGLEATLLVIGKGNEALYAQRAAKAGVKIVFAGIVRDGLAGLYAGCDVFALPSKWDAFAMVVAEAMAASLPVLISDKTGARDVVVEGENGFVLGLDDTSAWTEALARLAGDTALRDQMATAAGRTAATLSWKHAADTILKMYRIILEA